MSFGEYHHAAIHAGQQLQVIGNCRDFVGGRSLAKLRAVPARHQLEAVLVENWTKRSDRAWELTAELDAGVARESSLAKAYVEWNVATKLRHVIVGPGDRIDAERDGHADTSENAQYGELAPKLSR